MIPGVPTWVLAGVGVLLVATVYWWYRERSARGVARRSTRDAKRAVGGLGVVLVGVAGVISGALEALADSGGLLFDALAPAWDIIAQLALTVLGWLALRGSLTMGATTFVTIALLVIVAGFAMGDS